MKNQLLIVMVIIALILCVIGVFAYLELSYRETEEEPEIELVETDNRISPYTNQGLIVEVLRIRHRGLLDQMLSLGTSWKNPPTFYWKTYVDGKECDPEGNLGYTGVYTMWDTFGKEAVSSFYIEEEQETSKVVFSIIEQTESGIFGRKTSDVERERIKVTYDYRTGRWTGDDSLKDADGMGHYLGETFEVWFNIYQSDYDHDGIPYWTEVNILGTDPSVDDSSLDPDEDGIPTSWEWKWDYDPFVWNDHMNLDPDIDGIENIEEYQMAKWFADPYQPDIYIETDGMEKRGFFDFPHEFLEEAQQMVIERLAQHGYWVYIDDGWPDGPVNGGGEMVAFHQNFDDVVGKQILEFYKHNFADERKGIFRYVLFGNLHGGFVAPYEYNKMDTIHIGTSVKHTLLTKKAFTPKRFQYTAAAAVLHELGHTFGLVPTIFKGNDIQPRSWGDSRYPDMPDDEFERYNSDYHSIMNYNYIYTMNFFDFSDGSNGAPYDMDDWKSLYLPAFQIDMVSYEESVDETFMDFEVSNEYPGVLLKGWSYDENLTTENDDALKRYAIMKNTDVDIMIYKENMTTENNNYTIRIYAKPQVEPVISIWSLVAEGTLDEETQDIDVYTIETAINEII